MTKMVAAFSVTVLAIAPLAAVDGGAPYGAPPRPDPASPPPPPSPGGWSGTLTPAPPTLPETQTRDGADRLLARERLSAGGFQEVPDPVTAARLVYAQCFRLASLDGSGHSASDCDTMPIFVPGSDIEEATQHNFDVITHSPYSISLNAVSSIEKYSLTLLEREWYNRVAYSAICPTPRGIQACDEYPFYTTLEGGPLADGESLLPYQLRMIDAGQNSFEGTLLGAFVTGCGRNQGAPRDPSREYLVIPLPQQQVLPSMGYCSP
jgi:hypothetical protein